MGLLEVLTVLFVALKLTGVIAWSWWLVLLPEIIAVGIYVIWVGFIGSIVGAGIKSAKPTKIKKFKRR